MNLATYVSTYGEAVASRLSPGRAVVESSVLRHHLLPFFGGTEIDRISRASVLDYLALKAKTLSPSTANSHLGILRKYLHDAVDRGVLATYPIRGRLQKLREPGLRQEMSDEEIASLRAALCSPAYFYGRARARDSADAIDLALETGLSRSDLLALRWGAVAGGAVTVLRRKTGGSVTVPLSGRARQILESRPVRSDRVFEGLSVATLIRHFEEAKRMAGITRRLRFHDLRHTFASRLASHGVPLQIIARCLGHATTKMSERYARPSTRSLSVVVEALEEGGGADVLAPEVGRRV